MMKIRLVLALVLVCLVSTSAFAVGGQKILYFSSSSYTFPAVGGNYYPDWDCPWDDHWWSYGSTSSYRIIYTYDECYEGGTPIAVCQYYNNGWQTTTCP